MKENKKAILIIILMIWIFCIIALNSYLKKETISEMIYYENDMECSNDYLEVNSRVMIEESGFGTSTINTSKFRNSAVISTPEGQVVSYFNTHGQAILALLKDDIIYKIKIQDNMQKRLLGDGHCSINIGYWNDRVWYAYGAHASSMYCGNIDIEDFYHKASIEANSINEKISYPQFYSFKNNSKFWFVYRNDADSTWYYLDLSNSENIELLKANKLCEGNIYINDIGISQDGDYLAIPFVERYPVGENNLIRNNGIYMFWSKDGGKSWKNSDNESLLLPVTISKVKKIIDIGTESNLINQESTYVTNDGEVYFTRVTDDNEDIPQIYLTKYNVNTNEISSYQITNNTIDFDLIGTGTLKLPISRSQVIVSKKFVHVIYRLQESIVISSAPRKNEGLLGSFEEIVIDNINVGYWEPNYDTVLWNEEDIICLFVQQVQQEEADQLNDEQISTPIYLYYFKEVK